MGPTSAFVLFSVIWFLVFLVVLPLRLTTQGDAGEVVPGTHKGAPHEVNLWRKARLATLWTLGLFAVAAGLILYGPVSVEDLDVFGRPGTSLPAGDGGG